MGNIFDEIISEKKNIFDEVLEEKKNTVPIGTPTAYGKDLEKKTNLAARIALEGAGDIGLTILAPEIGVPANISKWGKRGISLINMLSKTAGSAVGSGGGSMAADVVSGNEIDWNRAKSAAEWGAGGEGSAAIIKPGLKAGSKFVAEHTAFGKALTDWNRTRTLGKETTKAMDMVSGFNLPKNTAQEAEEKIARVFPRSDEYFGGYQDAFKEMKKAAGDAKIDLNDTMQFIGDVAEKYDNKIVPTLRAMGITSTSEYGKVLKKLWPIDPNGMSLDQSKWLIDKVWAGNASFGSLSPDTIKLREGLKASLLKDFENAPVYKWEPNKGPSGGYVETSLGKEVAETKRYADEIMKDFQENVLKKNPIIKKALQRSTAVQGSLLYEAFPGTFFNDLMTKSSVDDLKRIKGVVTGLPQGKEAWAAFEFAFMDDLFVRSSNQLSRAGDPLLATIRQSDAGRITLRPIALAENLKTMMPKIETVFPETYSKVKDLPEYYTKLGKELEKVDKGRAMSLVGPGVAFAVLGPQGIALSEIGGLISAWSVISPSSRKILEAGRYLVGKPATHSVEEMFN